MGNMVSLCYIDLLAFNQLGAERQWEKAGKVIPPKILRARAPSKTTVWRARAPSRRDELLAQVDDLLASGSFTTGLRLDKYGNWHQLGKSGNRKMRKNEAAVEGYCYLRLISLKYLQAVREVLGPWPSTEDVAALHTLWHPTVNAFGIWESGRGTTHVSYSPRLARDWHRKGYSTLLKFAKFGGSRVGGG